MAVNYTNAAKAARMQATADHFVSGTLEIGTAGMAAVLATFTFTATQTGVSNGVWTLQFTSGSVTASGTGTAAAAQLKTSGAVADLTGLDVSTSGANINLDSVSITSGQTVTLSSATITHAA